MIEAIFPFQTVFYQFTPLMTYSWFLHLLCSAHPSPVRIVEADISFMLFFFKHIKSRLQHGVLSCDIITCIYTSEGIDQMTSGSLVACVPCVSQ